MTLSSTRARMLTVGGGGIAAVALIGGTATAASVITAKQLATGSVNSRVVKDGAIHQHDLSAHVGSLLHKNGLAGAYYSVAKYDAGDTNGGAIATVACKQATDVAISGGVQTLGVDGSQADPHNNGLNNNVPVSDSFPGR